MNFNFLRNPALSNFWFSESGEKAKNIFMAVIVVLAVSGSFLYLFERNTPQGGFLGNLSGTIPIERSTEQEEEKESNVGETAEEQKGFYSEKAEEGDGLTHVARKVLRKHIQKEGISGVKEEHIVFMEDYIQKNLGGGPLSLGEEVAVSFELVNEAFQKAELLTDEQLENLKQYSLFVSYL